MECGTSVMEQSQTGSTIKTEEDTEATQAVCIHNEIDINHLKQETGLLQSVKSEPAVLVKTDLAEQGQASNSCEDDGLCEANSKSEGDWINVKPELEEMEIGPTVLQHMDIHYALNESTEDGCNEEMRWSGVKKSEEDNSRDDKATSHNFGQMTTEVVYDETRIKSHLGQQKYLQKHLHQQRVTGLDGLKSDRTLHKPHLLSVCNKLHQRNNRNSVTTRGSVSGPSHPIGDKRTKTKQNRDVKFVHSEDINVNKRVQTGEKPFQCTFCDARFSYRSILSRHVRVHSGEKPFICNICDTRFTRSSNLTQHMKVHTGEKPFPCMICDARFTQSSHLTQHMKVHTGMKPFQCKICDARFAQSSNLTSHMRVHTGEKPFRCTFCDARFSYRSFLSRHVRVHSGEKPFLCTICDAKFTRSSILTQHMKVHIGEKPFSA